MILTVLMISSTTSIAEEKKSLKEIKNTDCIEVHKISPAALGCGVKKLFIKKDGSPNLLRKIFNAKSLADLKN